VIDEHLKPRALCTAPDGKIIPPLNLEVIVSDHCNIACRQCNHASPIMRKWNASVEEMERSLNLLTGVYHCKRLRILGGEPLLNPKLVDLIQVAKRSGIGDIVQLTTNGMLLDRLPDEGWRALDEIEISLYKISKLKDAQIETFKRKGKQFGTDVNVSEYPNFRVTFSTQKTDNDALIKDVWQACKMINVWGCHTLREGVLYRCPQSVYVPGITGGELTDEGFALVDNPGLIDDLMDYFNAPGPLKSCAHCVGSSGKKIHQASLGRREWKEDLHAPIEEMVDFDLLERSKREAKIIDDCRTPVKEKNKFKKLIKKVRSLYTL